MTTPIHYKLRIVPDLYDFTFKAQLEIQFTASRTIQSVELNAIDLDIKTCDLILDEQASNCIVTGIPEKESVQIALPQAVVGEFRLAIDYTGIINDNMSGFYRSRYEKNGKTHFIAVTQFQESDARRAFPCIDHPAAKATFDIEMIIPEGLIAISNNQVVEETSLPEGKKRIRFKRTPKMSTYLLFLGVGEFEKITDSKDRRVALLALPGRSQYGQKGLVFGRQSLEYSETYYGLDYQLDKMDLIAVPDFAFGAMENWGAITFRENLLLYYPGVTSRAGEERIFEVTAHEVAHQWFGNLVTPSDWRYLWLNESFATYFGFGVVNHYHDDWEIWPQFLDSETDRSMERDALTDTIAIEIPGGEHVVINTSTAPIIYSKGGSLLRQIEGYIGPDNFKKGLRLYLKTHAYDCAASHHLWEAMEEAAQVPVTRMVKNWVEQPGFPLVNAHQKGNTLHLSQSRFTFSQEPSDQTWIIPVIIKYFFSDGSEEVVTHLMENRKSSIPLKDGLLAYKINHGQTGYYRTAYRNKKNQIALEKLIQNGKLSQEDRWGIQNDVYNLVKAGQKNIDEYLQLIKLFTSETAFLPLTSIAANLAHAFRIAPVSCRKKISDTGRSILEGALNRVGYTVKKEDTHSQAILRDQLLWVASQFDSETVKTHTEKAMAQLKTGNKIHPDILKSTLQASALNGDEKLLEWMIQRLEATQIEHERLTLLAALGAFRNLDILEKVRNYILTNVPDRNRFIPIAAMATNPFNGHTMWQWFKEQYKTLERSHPLLYERVIASVIPIAPVESLASIKAFLDDYLIEHPALGDVISLSLERLEINIRIRSNMC